MSTYTTTGLYPFDPYGNSPENKITDEGQALQVPGRDDYYFLIPRAAPFYITTLIVKSGNGTVYEEGVDYLVGHTFVEATHQTGKAIGGSIRFLRRDITGMVYLTYQTIGGEWGFDDTAILEELSSKLVNPLIRSWGQIDPLPNAFPPVPHDQSVDEMIGFEEVTDSLKNIREAIEAAAAGATSDHINNRDNPHQVTKAQVGLGSVNNYPVATVAESAAASRNDRYMTPARTKVLVNEIIIKDHNRHVTDTDNPHRVTKTQVGLGRVENFATASIAETIEGSSTTLYTTPKGVIEAIESTVGSSSVGHFNNTDNPHAVTKAQVGLGVVENFPPATAIEAREATRNDRYMTPSLTLELVKEKSNLPLQGHINDQTNPHRVTKTQVGLGNVSNYKTATIHDTVSGTANNLYTTPRGVREAIANAVGGDISDHYLDETNPHKTTASQVGAYSTEETDMLLSEKLGVNQTAVNADKTYGLTKPQLLSEIAGITANDSERLGGNTLDEVLNLVRADTLLEIRFSDISFNEYVGIIKRNSDSGYEDHSVTYLMAVASIEGTSSVVAFSIGTGSYSVNATVLNNTSPDIEFYTSLDASGELYVWVKRTARTKAISLMAISGLENTGVETLNANDDDSLITPTPLGGSLSPIEVVDPISGLITDLTTAFSDATNALN